MNGDILIPFPPGCVVGALQRRIKRFTVEFFLDDRLCCAHTNNSGSMLGLMRQGAPVLVSPAIGGRRRLAYTVEMVGLPGSGKDGKNAWAGVNTLTPNRLLLAAFKAGKLPWAAGYTHFQAEVRRGQSRLDAVFSAPGLPRLWVECKNVTLVEDGVAVFPDAASKRGQKHLREMTDIAASGERAAFFYCVQRPDAHCFSPADYIDPLYADLFLKALASGVESHPHHAPVDLRGVSLGDELPLAPMP
ncbi:MAG: DNA/RNA nuclease SfsA [Desulfovibrio sp.]|jgi:sugar fermentation stimulation protein A|nr:DNA/RNA nuclease SfsA [Desulfovibrio sp.]